MKPPLSSHSPGGRAAFTMIELMVVVALMGLVLAMGIPAIREAVHRDPLTQATRDIMEACSKARARAIMTGNISALLISPKDRRFSVGDVPAGEGAPERPVEPPPRTDKIPGFSAKLSDQVEIRMLDVNFVEFKDEPGARVRFYPNGTSDEFTIILHSLHSGEDRRISLELVTALPEIVPISQ